MWSRIRNLTRSITKNSDDHEEKNMKIKFNSDNELPLNKTRKIPTMTTIVRANFYKKYQILSTGFLRWMSPWNKKMDSKDELKEIDNKNGACHYFNIINKCRDINFSDIFLNEKLYDNISV